MSKTEFQPPLPHEAFDFRRGLPTNKSIPFKLDGFDFGTGPSLPPPIINGEFRGKDIISLRQFDKQSIERLFEVTRRMREIGINAIAESILAGTNSALLFYEPSTRTRDSFDAATKQLGGQTIGSHSPRDFSSVAKGENLYDTIKTEEGYGDLIVIRSDYVGAAQEAADAAETVPVINAGDGIGEHPTQALLDMFTIFEHFGRLDNLRLLIAGDIKNGRTIHSLMEGLSLYRGSRVTLLSPPSLALPPEKVWEFQEKGLSVHQIYKEEDIPYYPQDVWYWTRVQRERFKGPNGYEEVKNSFVVDQSFLDRYGSVNMIIMHPFPRVGEITQEVDKDPRAFYFKQIRNGMYIRMALIALILGKVE